MICSTFVIQSHKLLNFPKAALVVWLLSHKGGLVLIWDKPPVWFSDSDGVGDQKQPPSPAGPHQSSQATSICIPSLHCDLFVRTTPQNRLCVNPVEGETKVCVCPCRLILLQSSAHPPPHPDPVLFFSRGGKRPSLKLRYTFRMALLAAVTAGHEPLAECFLESLSWHIVTVTVLIPQRAFFFFSSCLSGTFECCS